MIVVIAILAGISVVAYRGIQDRARDATVLSEATSFGKLVQMKYATDGFHGHGGEAPPSKAVLLGVYYDAASLSDSIHAIGYDAAANVGDKSKVHVLAGWSEIVVAYWSYQKDRWIHVTYNDGEDFPTVSKIERTYPPGAVH